MPNNEKIQYLPLGGQKKEDNKQKKQSNKLMAEVGMAVQKSAQTRVVG